MVIPRASGFVAGLEVYPPWRGGPWDELLPMALKDRLKTIDDPALTERLIEFARANEPIVPAEQIYHLAMENILIMSRDPNRVFPRLPKKFGTSR